jgi:uncharacterized membrane protein YidH (DUF202 family)
VFSHSYIVFSIFVVFIFLSIRKKKVSIVGFLPLFYLTSLVYGYLGLLHFGFARGMPFELGDGLNENQFEMAEFAFFLAITFYSFGASIANINTSKIKNKEKNRLGIFKFNPIINLNIPKILVYPVLILPVLSLGASYGFSELIYRDEYLPEVIPIFKSIGLFSIPISIIIGYLTNVDVWIRRFFIFIYVLILMSLSSRFLVLIPFFMLVSNYFRTKKIEKFKGLFLFFLMIVFLIISLQLRRLEFHGLVPYINHIISYGVDFDLLYEVLNYVSAFSYSLTAYILSNESVNNNLIYVSLSPLPGGMVNWVELSRQLRVNPYVPYNAISELFSFSPYLLGFYYFLIGFIFSKIHVYRNKFNPVIYLFLQLLIIMFVVFSMQYNLRSATRIIYYCLFIIVMSGAMHILIDYLFSKNLLRERAC